MYKRNGEPNRLFAVEYGDDVICAELVNDKPKSAWIEPKNEFYEKMSNEGWETDYNTAFTFTGKGWP